MSTGGTSHKSTEEVLNELLTLPQPPSALSGKVRKKAVNGKAQELTDDSVLREMKQRRKEKRVGRRGNAKQRRSLRKRREGRWSRTRKSETKGVEIRRVKNKNKQKM